MIHDNLGTIKAAWSFQAAFFFWSAAILAAFCRRPRALDFLVAGSIALIGYGSHVARGCENVAKAIATRFSKPITSHNEKKPMQTTSRFSIQTAVACICLAWASNALAHYLWVSVDAATQASPVADIYFEEAPKPGDGHYLDHFLGKSDVWIRTIEQPKPEPVQAAEVKQGANRWMRVALPAAVDYSIDAYGKFGVYAYGKTKVLLHYYARNLSVNSHDAMHELGRAEQLNLDLVPHDVGSKVEFTLLWKGKPAADRMVFVRGPKGFQANLKTDQRGKILLSPTQSGRHTLRSSVEEQTPGVENEEPYELIRHNITLVMTLDSSSSSREP